MPEVVATVAEKGNNRASNSRIQRIIGDAITSSVPVMNRRRVYRAIIDAWADGLRRDPALTKGRK